MAVLHIGIFCTTNIFDNNRNSAILANVSEFCGKLVMLPLENGAELPRFAALIINGLHKQGAETLEHMPADSFALINTDKRGCYSRIRRYSGTLITYGLNQKACITASSIIDDGTTIGGQMQVCIQRSFPTIGGGCAAVQEFPVHMHALGVEVTLALVGIMLVCGAKVDIIDRVFNLRRLMV